MSELAPRGLWLKTRVRDYLFCTSASRVIKIFVCIYDHSRESTNKFITEYCNASLDWIGMFVSARLTIRDSSFKPEGIGGIFRLDTYKRISVDIPFIHIHPVTFLDPSHFYF